MFCRVVQVIFYFKEKGKKSFKHMNISKSRISLHYSCGSRISSTELFVPVILKREVQFCTVSKSAEEKIFNHKAPNSLQSLASNLCGCTKGSNGYTALLGTF